MKHPKNGQSITGQVNMAFRTLTAILVLPAVISLALLLVNAAWYQSSMLRMEEVAALKPVVSTDIPEMVWVAVSGRATFENCGVYEAIDEVKGMKADSGHERFATAEDLFEALGI